MLFLLKTIKRKSCKKIIKICLKRRQEWTGSAIFARDSKEIPRMKHRKTHFIYLHFVQYSINTTYIRDLNSIQLSIMISDDLYSVSSFIIVKYFLNNSFIVQFKNTQVHN